MNGIFCVDLWMTIWTSFASPLMVILIFGASKEIWTSAALEMNYESDPCDIHGIYGLFVYQAR